MDTSEAIRSIQEVTDILKNMFSHIQNFKDDEFKEISSLLISVIKDHRFQIGIFLIIIVSFKHLK